VLKVLKYFLTKSRRVGSRKDPSRSDIRDWHTEVYITGPNTNGRQLAFQNPTKNKEKKLRVGDWDLTIGSSPDCWITLPDSSLPDITAAITYIGHHTYMVILKPGCVFDLHRHNNFIEKRFGDRQHIIGEYLIEFGDYL